MSLPFSNRYYHRTAASDSSCFICGKFTTAVLTHKDIDWFYVCLNHLQDPSFCKPIPLPPPVQPASAPAPEPPKEKDDKKEIEEDKKEDGKDKKDEKKEEKKKEKKEVKKPPAPAPVVPPPAPKEFILDSKIFYLRENQYRKKMQQRNAKQISNQLPSVPRNHF